MATTRYMRIGYLAAAAIMALLAVGLTFGQPWATWLWPWTDGSLTLAFAGAALAAIAAPAVWIALTDEWGASAGSAIFPIVAGTGIGLSLLWLAGQASGPYLGHALGSLLLAAIGLSIHLWSRRIPLRDGRPTPRAVRLSFVAFAAVLLLSGAALLLVRPDTMPWPVKPETSILIGWIFVGASSAYIYAVLRPSWHHARGPLLGFLAYDLVLLPRLLLAAPGIRPELQQSFMIYIAVLVYSALLGVIFLFLNPATRDWRPQPAPAPTPAAASAPAPAELG